MEDIYCPSSNIFHAYQCYVCNKHHVAETSFSLPLRPTGHRLAIERKPLRSSLFTHLKVKPDHSSLPDYQHQYLVDYILMLIEQIYSLGSDWQNRINILNEIPFWIDTPGSLEQTGLNKKRSEDILESAEKSDTVVVLKPFTKTNNIA